MFKKRGTLSQLVFALVILGVASGCTRKRHLKNSRSHLETAKVTDASSIEEVAQQEAVQKSKTMSEYLMSEPTQEEATELLTWTTENVAGVSDIIEYLENKKTVDDIVASQTAIEVGRNLLSKDDRASNIVVTQASINAFISLNNATQLNVGQKMEKLEEAISDLTTDSGLDPEEGKNTSTQISVYVLNPNVEQPVSQAILDQKNQATKSNEPEVTAPADESVVAQMTEIIAQINEASKPNYIVSQIANLAQNVKNLVNSDEEDAAKTDTPEKAISDDEAKSIITSLTKSRPYLKSHIVNFLRYNRNVSSKTVKLEVGLDALKKSLEKGKEVAAAQIKLGAKEKGEATNKVNAALEKLIKDKKRLNVVISSMSAIVISPMTAYYSEASDVIEPEEVQSTEEPATTDGETVIPEDSSQESADDQKDKEETQEPSQDSENEKAAIADESVAADNAGTEKSADAPVDESSEQTNVDTDNTDTVAKTDDTDPLLGWVKNLFGQ